MNGKKGLAALIYERIGDDGDGSRRGDQSAEFEVDDSMEKTRATGPSENPEYKEDLEILLDKYNEFKQVFDLFLKLENQYATNPAYGLKRVSAMKQAMGLCSDLLSAINEYYDKE